MRIDSVRIGSVSGGCLEGELCRRAHWWTASEPAVVRSFDTSMQDDDEGYGLGCGGAIDLLLERLAPPGAATAAHPLLAQERVARTREAEALAVVTHAAEGSSRRVGERFCSGDGDAPPSVRALLDSRLRSGVSGAHTLEEGPLAGCTLFVEVLAPPGHLLVCGAGADAAAMVSMATAVGWQVTVLDQRPDLARPDRFPEAAAVMRASAERLRDLRIDARTAAIVMSHSFAQDTFFLRELTGRPLGYLGVLGAKRRTEQLLAALGPDAAAPALHAPAGLDIGAETPEQIALSILGEMQAVLAGRGGGPLRSRRGSIHGRDRGDGAQTARAASGDGPRAADCGA